MNCLLKLFDGLRCDLSPQPVSRAHQHVLLLLRFCFYLAMFTAGVIAFPQRLIAQTNYTELLRVKKEASHALGESPFGEDINIYTGELSFLQTDAIIEGIGPPIVISRTDKPAWIGSMRDWSLSIPRIDVMVKRPSRTVLGTPGDNWRVVAGAQGLDASYKRCSDFNIPYDPDFEQVTWWLGLVGYRFFTESGDVQSLLGRVPVDSATERPHNSLFPDMKSPEGTSYVFPIVTNRNWQVGCLPRTKNGEKGEGFMVVSPAGIKYYLDYLVGVRAPDHVDYGGGERPVFTGLMFASMLVTKIEDSSGNSLNFSYDGANLSSIVASDGRRVSFLWETVDEIPRIAKITVAASDTSPRIWRYLYNQHHLSGVVLPDETSWEFGLSNAPRPTPLIQGTCTTRTMPAVVSPVVVNTMKHPSGLIGKFTVSAANHGRSYVQSWCIKDNETNFPFFGTGSVVKKEIGGPGTPNYVWQYAYQPATGSTTGDACAQSDTCAATKWVDVTDPDGHRVRYTLSTRVGETEGRLLKKVLYDETSSARRTETYEYARHNQGPFPALLGKTVDYYSVNNEKNETLSPMSSVVITQDGATYVSKISAFDRFGRPATVAGSSPTGSKKELLEYHDSLTHWKLGQTAKVTVNGVEVSRTTFDATTALPLQTFSFGKLEQTFTYNADGTMATAKDGSGNITRMGSWKRGIPQSVTFADGRTQRAVVNDAGWVSSVTDENGFVTAYTYDPMGRMASTTYPTGDNTAWHPTTYTFEYRNEAEHGLPAGHWLRRQNTGNHRKNIFLDSLWRPVLVHEYDATDVEGTLVGTRTQFDSEGRVIFTSYPANSRVPPVQGLWTEYDALGRVTSFSQDSEWGLLTTTTSYASDSTGPYTQAVDPNGSITKTWHQMFDQPTYDAPIRIETAEGLVTEIKRDVFGKPLEINRK